jgi:hypothetical protein
MAAKAGDSAFGPGSSVTFTVTPSQAQAYLSIAMMIGQTNDVFIGTRSSGVMLLDSNGIPRPAVDVQKDLMHCLATWDAGTESNEVPGVGPNQGPRQLAPNTGEIDPMNVVRLYSDSTNDLAKLPDLVAVTVTHTTGMSFNVKVANRSGNSAFPLKLSPVAWATHSKDFGVFAIGEIATPEIEMLAEDGNPTALLDSWMSENMVGSSGRAGTGPIADGMFISFDVMVDISHPNLNIATMIVPSNDTFAALGPMGVPLLDSSGSVRSDESIAADISNSLNAYESGTEANQGGALGPDMAPFQSGPNMGASEGSGRSRALAGVWPYPNPMELVKVTLLPR